MTKVLVFESEPGFAWELRTELGRLGCTVQIVDDGNAGLQIAASDRPDLILLSIELPRMNGFSVCNRLKKDPQLKDVPLIIMSSESSDETFEQHRRLKTRAEDYVRKPIALGELVRHIRQFVPISAEIEPEAIFIDDAVVFDEEVEDRSLTVPAAAAPPEARHETEPDSEIDDFLGGAFDRLIVEDEPKPKAPPKQQSPSFLPDPPTIPAPPPPAPPPPIVLGAVPPPPPPPPRVNKPESVSSARAPSVVPPSVSAASTKGPVTARSAPPSAALSPSDPIVPSSKKPPSTSDASTIEQLRIELGRSKEELGRNKDEISRLTLDLDASRANVQQLEEQAAGAREDADEVVRLQREVEDLKAKLGAAGAAARTGPSRELLDLREGLNKKDKEILSLRDQLTSKDKELLDLRDSTLALERDKADLTDRLGEIERATADLEARVERYREERDYYGLRAENFEALTAKLESKLMAATAGAAAKAAKAEAEVATRIAALEANLGAADEAVAAERSAKEVAQASLEQAQRAVADAEARITSEAARHEAERERLVSEHSAQITSLTEKHAAELRALNEAHAEEVDAAHETEIAKLRQEHINEIEQLAATHAAQIEAVRTDNQRVVDALKAEHATQIEAVRTDHQRVVDALKAEHATQVEGVRTDNQRVVDALKAEHAAKVEAMTRDADERLAARNREFADERARKTAELETLHAQALKQAEHDAAEKVRAQVVEHYETKLRVLEGQHATAVETFRSDRDRAIADLDAASRSAVQELDRQLSALGADLQDTRIKLEGVEEQRRAQEAEVRRLEGELAAHRGNVERLEGELRASKAEAESLGAEKDRSAAEATATASRITRMRARWDQDRLVLERTREALTQAAARLQEIETQPTDED